MGLDLQYGFGQTPVSEEELDELLIRTITTRKELDEFEQQNIEKALEWLMRKKISLENILSEDFIFLLHRKMFGEVWSWAGTQRKSNKNIGVEWTMIRIELRNLLDDVRFWIEKKVYSQDEIALRFSHRLVSIHIFPNGNGRHSRLMADIIAERIFLRPPFTWGSVNLTSQGEAREAYISALRLADQNSFAALIAFARS